MALNAATTWEVRTTGADTNGGGYYIRDAVNGIDYTQQDAAQLSLSDGYFTSGTTFISDTGGFTHAMEGNLINIASGTHFTAGFYEIVTYTDSNTVVLDRAPASEDTSAHKDAVFKVGGALLTISKATDNSAASNIVYVQSGTYAEQITFVVSTLKIIGYITNRTTTPFGTDRPYINGSSARSYCFTDNGSTSGFNLYHLRCANATSHGIYVQGNNAWGTLVNIKSSNNGGSGIAVQDYGVGECAFVSLLNIECNNNTNYGIANGDRGLAWDCDYGSYYHDNGWGGAVTGRSNNAFCCIYESNTGHGYNAAWGYGSTSVKFCIAYNNTGSNVDGFTQSGGTCNNNCALANARYGFTANTTAQSYTAFNFNCYHDNGGATEINGWTAGPNDIGDQDPLFTDAANGDFSYQAGSPALDAGVNNLVF